MSTTNAVCVSFLIYCHCYVRRCGCVQLLLLIWQVRLRSTWVAQHPPQTRRLKVQRLVNEGATRSAFPDVSVVSPNVQEHAVCSTVENAEEDDTVEKHV